MSIDGKKRRFCFRFRWISEDGLGNWQFIYKILKRINSQKSKFFCASQLRISAYVWIPLCIDVQGWIFIIYVRPLERAKNYKCSNIT